MNGGMFAPAAWFFGAYLLGSIPVAWLLARWVTGQDLRQTGSGNVGVMNTALSVARWAGLVVFLSEIAKGVLAVAVPHRLNAGAGIVYLCMVAVLTGTRWPVWLGFKGGRANTAGMAAYPLISYPAAAATVAFWILARLLLNSSFKATRLTFLAMPVIAGLVTRSILFTGAMLVMSVIYLTAQRPETDDHTLINQRWSSFRNFLIAPPRRGKRTP
jgi:glycerol-3-phosphate acyltransferase PlsY